MKLALLLVAIAALVCMLPLDATALSSKLFSATTASDSDKWDIAYDITGGLANAMKKQGHEDLIRLAFEELPVAQQKLLDLPSMLIGVQYPDMPGTGTIQDEGLKVLKAHRRGTLTFLVSTTENFQRVTRNERTPNVIIFMMPRVYWFVQYVAVTCKSRRL